MLIDLKYLYNQYYKLVYNIALQYVQNNEDAEEISQDVFVKINDKLHLFKQQSDISTWIYRIAINQSLDFLKARKTKKRWLFFTAISLNNDAQKIDIPHFEHPGVALEQKEALQTIFNSINQLPDNQKTILLLLKIHQHSLQEAANIMEISYKAADSLFYRAKINLEKLLTNNEEI